MWARVIIQLRKFIFCNCIADFRISAPESLTSPLSIKNIFGKKCENIFVFISFTFEGLWYQDLQSIGLLAMAPL